MFIYLANYNQNLLHGQVGLKNTQRMEAGLRQFRWSESIYGINILLVEICHAVMAYAKN